MVSLGLVSKPMVRVSWLGLKTKVGGFSRFGLKIGSCGFPGLSLKIGSYGLMI
jgi:hypothetical protein